MPAADASRVSLKFLLRPRWIAFHLLVVVAVVGMINLGFWQLRRLDQRRSINAAISTRYDESPVSLDQLVGGLAVTANSVEATEDPVVAEVEWRPVTVSGSYVAGADVEIVNRSQDGVAGSQALSPLALADGRILLVNRGFVPLGADSPPPPTGQITLIGRLRPSQTRHFGGLSDPASGPLESAQRIDIGRLAQQFDGPVVPMYVELTMSQPPSDIDGIPAPIKPPELSEGNHLSYALQWFIFAGAVSVGWVLAVRRSIGQRRVAAGGEPTTADATV